MIEFWWKVFSFIEAFSNLQVWKKKTASNIESYNWFIRKIPVCPTNIYLAETYYDNVTLSDLYPSNYRNIN